MIIPDWSQRIVSLRKRLGLKQSQFAEAVGVTQAAVSQWESAKREPSSENYIRMGNMAGHPDGFWFWEKAGVDLTQIKAGVQKRRKAKR